MAPLLDAGYKQMAYCTKILNGWRTPIPVVEAALYRADAMIAGAVSSSEVPARSTLPNSATSGCGCVVGLAAGLLLVVLIAVISC